MSESSHIQIVKNTGEREVYDRAKLRSGLEKAGANDGENQRVIEIVEAQLHDGIPTWKIYQLAYAELKRLKSHKVAGRYRLKTAIFSLGPTGYPFEIFIGRLFESFGFHTEVGVFMPGKCVQHEVDVVATKGNRKVIVECKFHHDKRSKTGVQVPMYILSRFHDIEEKWQVDHPDEPYSFEGFVVTNTRFSQDAMDFARCAGLGMRSWDYPLNDSLRYHIDRSGLHPLTSLHSLRRHEQKVFLEKGIVLSSELKNHQQIMRDMGFSEHRIKNVLREAENLVKN